MLNVSGDKGLINKYKNDNMSNARDVTLPNEKFCQQSLDCLIAVGYFSPFLQCFGIVSVYFLRILVSSDAIYVSICHMIKIML